MSDERIKKDTSAGGRESRSAQDVEQRAPADESVVSAQERRRMFRNEWVQEALPTPPPIPGYHLCWLSTTNQYDPIHRRMRMGYVPVKAEELPGFENMRVKSGEHEGHISVNEMVLFKLPMDIYQQIMREMHHDAPLEETQKIREQVERLQGAQDQTGKSLGQIEGDGIRSLKDENRPAPVFN